MNCLLEQRRQQLEKHEEPDEAASDEPECQGNAKHRLRDRGGRPRLESREGDIEPGAERFAPLHRVIALCARPASQPPRAPRVIAGQAQSQTATRTRASVPSTLSSQTLAPSKPSIA